jgi:hypothetical protein
MLQIYKLDGKVLEEKITEGTRGTIGELREKHSLGVLTDEWGEVVEDTKPLFELGNERLYEAVAVVSG